MLSAIVHEDVHSCTDRLHGHERSPGMIFSEARYVRETAAPPGFMMGPKRCSMDT